MPKGARWTLYALVSLLFVGVVWASCARIDKTVEARGKLVTMDGMLVVQPLETAVIRSIDVQIGDTVKKDDILVTLDPTFASADATQLRSRLDSVNAQIRRLEVESMGELFTPPPSSRASIDERLQASIAAARQREYTARIEAYDQKVSNLQAALATNAEEQKGLEGQLKVLEEVEQMFNKLHQQEYGSKLRLLEANKEKLVTKGNMSRLNSQAEELRRQIDSQKAEKQAFLEEWNRKIVEEMVELRREGGKLNEELSKATRRTNLVQLTAPADAVVLEIAQRSVGSVVREAEQLITLVPLDSKLEAEVEVTPSDIGRIEVGQPVRIKLDAFPFQKHGIVDGTIRTISENTIQGQLGATVDEEGKPKNPGTSQQQMYRIRVELTNTKLRNVLPNFRLLPGMTLVGEIKVGNRSVMSYFLYPIIKGLDESIREP